MQTADIISTKSQESIERCRDRIELMVMGTRERSAFTHFVSLPMNHAVIQAAFTQFAELVQNDDELPVRIVCDIKVTWRGRITKIPPSPTLSSPHSFPPSTFRLISQPLSSN